LIFLSQPVSETRMIVSLRRVKTAGFLLALLALASCSSRVSGALTPVDIAAAGASRVDLLVATTRQQNTEKPNDMFTGERGDRLSFADIAISIPPSEARTIGEVQWPSRIPGDPTKEFVATRAKVISVEETQRLFHQRLLASKGRAIIFVHGYNSNFDDAVFRFAQIMHDSKAPGVPVLFTWPSRGELLAYAYDRESTNFSRDGLGVVLATLSKDPNVREIGILAHSMGNWVTMEALRDMSFRNGRVHPKITDVMLAAPDLDTDVFRRQMAALGEKHPRMTLFVSKDDRALEVSSRLWGGQPRLGSIDPAKEPFRTGLQRSGIAVVDLTQLKSGDSLAHGKFAESPEVVRFIGTRLSQGQVINENKRSLSQNIVEGATNLTTFVGGTAARVVTSPLTIVEGGKVSIIDGDKEPAQERLAEPELRKKTRRQ
jgi:esterase/lipase superfamily enzyme